MARSMARRWSTATSHFCTTATWSTTRTSASLFTGWAAPGSGFPPMPARPTSDTGSVTSRPIPPGTSAAGTTTRPIASQALRGSHRDPPGDRGPTGGIPLDRWEGQAPPQVGLTMRHATGTATAIPLGLPADPEPTGSTARAPWAASEHPLTAVPGVIGTATVTLQVQPGGRAPIGRTRRDQPVAPAYPLTAVPGVIGTATVTLQVRPGGQAPTGRTARDRPGVPAHLPIAAPAGRATQTPAGYSGRTGPERPAIQV
jgi:hypothetical protein